MPLPPWIISSPPNALITSACLVPLIISDKLDDSIISFTYKVLKNSPFEGDMITPDYIAPESIGKPPSQLGREQDIFALSVLINLKTHQ